MMDLWNNLQTYLSVEMEITTAPVRNDYEFRRIKHEPVAVDMG